MMSHGVERVRLERRQRLSGSPLRKKAHLEIDIMGVLGGSPIALELKYPKRRFTGTAVTDGEAEDFDLPASGAPDVDAAAIWHDAERIERLLDEGTIERLLDEGTVVSGAALALSNYPFWSDATLRRGTKAYAFRLWDGREVQHEVLQWEGAAISYDTGPVTLNSRYALTWYDFSNPAGHPDGTEFKYLILEPEMSVRS